MTGKWKAIKKYRLNPDKLEEVKYLVACAEGNVVLKEKLFKGIEENLDILGDSKELLEGKDGLFYYVKSRDVNSIFHILIQELKLETFTF